VKLEQTVLRVILAVWLAGLGISGASAQPWNDLLRQADSLMSVGEFDAAAAISRQALHSAETTGEASAVVLTILDTLGQIEIRRQHFEAAEGCYRRHLELSQETYGVNSSEASESLYLLGGLALEQGHLLAADSLYARCLVLRRRIFGRKHPKVAKTLDQLGLSAYDQGRFADAESYTTRALAILEKTSAADKADLIIALNNLARTLDAQCRYAKAEETYKRALSLSRTAFGTDHLYVASALTNLGILYWRQHKYTEAESNYRAALDIYETKLNDRDPTLAYICRALGAVYEDLGRFADAEQFHRRALTIDSAAFGLNHPNTAVDMNNIGSFYLRVGNLASAEEFLRCAITAMEQTTGPDHPDLASLLGNLSSVYRKEVRWEEARNLERRAYAIRRQNFRDGFDVLSEENALLYSGLMRTEAARLVSRLLEQGGQTLRDRTEIAEIILATKGQVSDGMFIRHRFYAERGNPTLRPFVDSLNAVRTRLAELMVSGVDASDPGKYRAEISTATLMKERLESDLARQSASIRRDNERWNIHFEQAAHALPARSVLIEFYRYEHDTGNELTENRYLAAAITLLGEVYLFPLGSASAIDDAIAAYQTHFQSPGSAAMDDYRQINRALYPLIWEPLEAVAGSAETVLIAPDGALNAVSFAGLMDRDGRYLIEKYAIHYLMTGRDLLRIAEEDTVLEQGLLAFGDPDFNHRAAPGRNDIKNPSGGEPVAAAFESRGIPAASSPKDRWKAARLPATRQEVQTAAESWKQWNTSPAKVYLGAEASEEAFKQECSKWRVLHIATHGFYFSESAPTAAADFNGSISNPLVRTGLLLAGANLPGKEISRSQDDGFLTAEEVALLNLAGTELVILSACVTGQGDIEAGEGVYGLRRAFQMAGARTVISALWPIDDKATAEFMSRLFSAPREETLPQTMQRAALARLVSLRNQGKSDHPFYWAAFVATGDWKMH
jgi:CHAT domain-containing protein/tetratricopeptide (TPR) repeat protein